VTTDELRAVLDKPWDDWLGIERLAVIEALGPSLGVVEAARETVEALRERGHQPVMLEAALVAFDLAMSGKTPARASAATKMGEAID